LFHHISEDDCLVQLLAEFVHHALRGSWRIYHRVVKLTAFVVEMVKLILTFYGGTFCSWTFSGQGVSFLQMFLGQASLDVLWVY